MPHRSQGVVAMAKTGTEPAGTSGSQFFVVTGEDAGLPPDYALLGKVTKGQEVVDRIGVAPAGPDEAADGARRDPLHPHHPVLSARTEAPSSASSTRLRSGPPP